MHLVSALLRLDWRLGSQGLPPLQDCQAATNQQVADGALDETGSVREASISASHAAVLEALRGLPEVSDFHITPEVRQRTYRSSAAAAAVQMTH